MPKAETQRKRGMAGEEGGNWEVNWLARPSRCSRCHPCCLSPASGGLDGGGGTGRSEGEEQGSKRRSGGGGGLRNMQRDREVGGCSVNVAKCIGWWRSINGTGGERYLMSRNACGLGWPTVPYSFLSVSAMWYGAASWVPRLLVGFGFPCLSPCCLKNHALDQSRIVFQVLVTKWVRIWQLVIFGIIC